MGNPKQREINWGIIGSGWVCREFAEGLKLVAGAHLSGVCSASIANAQAFAQRFGVAKVHAEVSQLLADSDIDAVYIGTPNSLHADHSCAALDAGKAVICEKPFTIDAAQARRVIQTARRNNLFCMEAMRTRFMPAMRHVRELLNDGAIGELRMFSATFGNLVPYVLDNRFFNPSLGGGALLDLGVYAVSIAHLVCGAPQRIVAAASIGPSGVDEQSAAVFSYTDGKLAVLSASLRTDIQSHAVISGSRGEIRIEPLYRPEWVSLRTFAEQEAAKPAAQGGAKQFANSMPGLRTAMAGGRRLMRTLRPAERAREHVPFEGNGFNYQAAEAMRCLRSGELESPIMPLDDTLKVMESLDAIRGGSG